MVLKQSKTALELALSQNLGDTLLPRVYRQTTVDPEQISTIGEATRALDEKGGIFYRRSLFHRVMEPRNQVGLRYDLHAFRSIEEIFDSIQHTDEAEITRRLNVGRYGDETIGVYHAPTTGACCLRDLYDLIPLFLVTLPKTLSQPVIKPLLVSEQGEQVASLLYDQTYPLQVCHSLKTLEKTFQEVQQTPNSLVSHLLTFLQIS